MPDQSITRPAQAGGTVTVRQDLVDEITIGGDLAPAAAAAAAKAEIEARIVAARKWRRDVDQFREGVLKDCRRPGFAETALYRKPVGKKQNPETGAWEQAFAIDFSIRFIEAALQHFGNVHVAARITHEDTNRALLNVSVIDVEKNTGYSIDAMLDKLIEKKTIPKGRTTLGMRENSYGDMVYLLVATKDEFRNVMGSERSKLIRDNGKRLLPPDVLAECREQIETTLTDETAKDPDSAKKKILDRFSRVLGISAAMLKEYLGQPLEALTPKDIQDLAVLFNGLKEGDFSWADVMRTKNEPAEGEPNAAQPAPESPRQKLRDRMAAQAKQTAPPAEKPEQQLPPEPGSK